MPRAHVFGRKEEEDVRKNEGQEKGLRWRRGTQIDSDKLCRVVPVQNMP